MNTQAAADVRGEWRVTVKTPAARPLDQGIRAEHITFTVPNENMVQIKDVLIGEVWLCTGQSNMTVMLGPDYPKGRNAWTGDPKGCNLYNEAGLPAAPFTIATGESW